MADAGMSEHQAQSLASVVRRVTRHQVAARPEAGYFVVVIYRAVPGDTYILRNERDWQLLCQRTHPGKSCPP